MRNIVQNGKKSDVFPTILLFLTLLSAPERTCCKTDTILAKEIQGDTSGCDEPPVDFKTKVPFWPGMFWPSQAKRELLF